MNLDVAILSERGPRSENEDSVISTTPAPDYALVGVADGLGGHAGGRTASMFALKSLSEKISIHPESSLAKIGLEIHSELKALQLEDKAYRAMATTLSAAVFHEQQMRFVHCGDTRIAVCRDNGIRRLTTDHSEAQRFYDLGKLTKEQFDNYPRKNILDSALGVKGTPRIDEGVFQLSRNDRVFITSDGFHNKFFIREIFATSKRCSTASEFIEAVSFEMKSRSVDDNYSIACAFVM